MLAVCFTAVVLRYAFGKPLVWSEEVILTMLIWFGFMCISIGAFGDSHIAIEGAYNLFPPAGKKACDILRHVLLTAFGCFMVYYGWKIFKINMMKRLPATHWPQGIQYFPMVFGGALTTIYSAVNLIECITGKTSREEEEA
jgi:TRAP-type C4-dicarboxylate transport system permease small subunit